MSYYAIVEGAVTIGERRSADNGREWIKSNGKTTQASNERAEWESREEAIAAAKDMGIDIKPNGRFRVVAID